MKGPHNEFPITFLVCSTKMVTMVGQWGVRSAGKIVFFLTKAAWKKKTLDLPTGVKPMTFWLGTSPDALPLNYMQETLGAN